jgi:hypothetical protein
MRAPKPKLPKVLINAREMAQIMSRFIFKPVDNHYRNYIMPT